MLLRNDNPSSISATQIVELRCELDRARGTADGLRRLLWESRCAFFEIDANGVVTTWNPAAVEALGVRESDAIGQPLEELIAEVCRPQIAQTLARAQRGGRGVRLGTVSLGPRNGSGLGTQFALTAFFDAGGRVAGIGGLAQPDAATCRAAAMSATGRNPLPAPVGGVAAWRCTLYGVTPMPNSFELSPATAACSDMHAQGLGKGFCDMVHQVVRENTPLIVMPGDRKPQAFDAEVQPFEDSDGTTRYFCVRGVATSGVEMPFGDSIGEAQGYVIDVTALRFALQDAERWHERWRTLARQNFQLSFLIDITELRVLSAWGDESFLGRSMADKSLLDFVRREDHAATDDLFSAALLPRDDPARCCNSQPLVFWHSAEKRLIPTECAIVPDAGDPSIHLVGVRRKDEVVASSKEPVALPKPARAENVSGPPGTETVETEGPPEKKPVPDAAPKPTSSSSKGLSQMTPKVMSLGSIGGGGGLKLTAAALAFSSGLSAPMPMPRKAPAPAATASKEVPSSREEAERSHGRAGAKKSGGDEGASSSQDVPKPPSSPSPVGEAPGGRPPAVSSSSASPAPAAGGGPPLAPGSPDKSNRPKAAPAPSKSVAGRSSGRHSSGASSPRSRVFPTQLVLREDEGTEIWRSSKVLLGEQILAAELLTKDGLTLVGMPKEISDGVSPETHLLYVSDDASGELLQVANLMGIPLQSLQRHCGPEGLLTIVLSPAEDSEDAFETIPGANDDD